MACGRRLTAGGRNGDAAGDRTRSRETGSHALGPGGTDVHAGGGAHAPNPELDPASDRAKRPGEFSFLPGPGGEAIQSRQDETHLVSEERASAARLQPYRAEVHRILRRQLGITSDPHTAQTGTADERRLTPM